MTLLLLSVPALSLLLLGNPARLSLRAAPVYGRTPHDVELAAVGPSSRGWGFLRMPWARGAVDKKPLVLSLLRGPTAEVWPGGDSPVSEHMKTSLVTLTAGMSLSEAARILERSSITGAPVVDDDGSLIGVLSRNDILFKIAGRRSLMLPGHGPRTIRYMENTARLTKIQSETVGESMSTHPITIAPTATMQDAAALMLRRNLNRVLVTHEGKLLGIISSTDVFHMALINDDEDVEDQQ